MSDPHLGFIVAAYALTFAVVGTTAAWITWRHRSLRRALARLGDEGDAGRERS